MLKVSDLSLSYKKKNVIKNASFEVAEGSIIGLLGSNGSGKSTLLSAIAGIKKPDSGNISINDINLNDNPTAYKKMFGYATQENPLIEELTGMDNLLVWSPYKKDEIQKIISAPPLSNLGVHKILDKKVSSMSGGMKKRLALTSILMSDPKVLLMDEPFSALDMVARYDIMEYIIAFKNAGGTVIIASHEDMVLKACDKVLFINKGIVRPAVTNDDFDFIDILRSSLENER